MGDLHFVSILERVTFQQLVCSRCDKFIFSIVWQCATGHNFCNCCFKELDTCPRCRSPKGTRNYAIERLRLKILHLTKRHTFACQCSVMKAENPLRALVMLELRCQLCMKYMKPPIPQCLYGHNGICNECFDITKRCATCSSPQAPGGHLSLELLLLFVQFFCKYRKYGCRYRGCESHAADHELVCDFAVRLCPIRFRYKCEWEGSEADIAAHCIKAHKVRVLPLGHPIVFDGRKLSGENTSFCVAYNRLFRCILVFHESEIVSGCDYFGESLESDRYRYEVSVLETNSNVVRIKLRGFCRNVVNDNLGFAQPYRIEVSCVEWTTSADEYENMNFTLKLIDTKGIDI